MTSILIRPLKQRDIESIIALDALITGHAGPDRAGFWRGLLSIHTVDGWNGEAMLESSPAPHLCEVAETTGSDPATIVGFIIGDVQSWQFGLPRHGRIVTIGVHPDYRRHGVAARLADSLMGTFRKLGLPFVHCLVRPGDPLAAFFGSLGFAAPQVGILEKHLCGPGSDSR